MKCKHKYEWLRKLSFTFIKWGTWFYKCKNCGRYDISIEKVNKLK